MSQKTKAIIAALIFGSLAVLAALLLAGGYGGSTTGGSQLAGTQAAPTLDATLVAQGKIIYESSCASCHGVNGEGQTGWQDQQPDGTSLAPAHTVEGHTWHHPDSYLFQYVSEGGKAFETPELKATMPGFGGTYSRDEIIFVLTYVKSFWGPQEIATQAQSSVGQAY